MAVDEPPHERHRHWLVLAKVVIEADHLRKTHVLHDCLGLAARSCHENIKPQVPAWCPNVIEKESVAHDGLYPRWDAMYTVEVILRELDGRGHRVRQVREHRNLEATARHAN